MKLNLGCGSDIKKGFVNMDITLADQNLSDGTKLRMVDLSGPWPSLNEDVDFIYSSHFLEHLTDSQASVFLRKCYDALSPGGVLRLLVPDFLMCTLAYMSGDEEFFSLIPISTWHNQETSTLIDQMTYLVYQNGEHRSIWDAQKLLKFLRAAGFTTAAQGVFDQHTDTNTRERERYSLVVQAIK